MGCVLETELTGLADVGVRDVQVFGLCCSCVLEGGEMGTDNFPLPLFSSFSFLFPLFFPFLINSQIVELSNLARSRSCTCVLADLQNEHGDIDHMRDSEFFLAKFTITFK